MPCGMPGVISTSIADRARPARRAAVDRRPSARAASIFARALGRRLDAELAGDLPA